MVVHATLFDFLESEQYDGGTLLDHLGGWYARAAPLRGLKIIAYHKNWSYFARAFGMEIVDFVEPKPGIPPTARHVKQIIDEINEYDIELMLVANYFERNTPARIEGRTGVKAIFLPISVTGEPGIDTLFELYDYWIEMILEALAVSG
jgi:ABC-type Zn uptake system ZnuABC Zn-binding protein ZnuA